MPPIKWIVSTVILIAILMVLALIGGVIIAYPGVTALIVAAIIAGTVYVVRRKRQRNLV